MDGFVMHMFYNELHVYFTTISYAFSLRILCMYMARNYNLLPYCSFFSFCVQFFTRFDKDVDYD